MLLDDISGKQLLEWEAFASIEPFGMERLDFLFAGLFSLLVNLARNIHGKAGTPMTTAQDFLPRWGFSDENYQKPEQSVDEMKQILKQIYVGNKSKK